MYCFDFNRAEEHCLVVKESMLFAIAISCEFCADLRFYGKSMLTTFRYSTIPILTLIFTRKYKLQGNNTFCLWN
jgi:hypothetical protein